MKDIKELRQDIDGIDREILELFEKRMELSGDIAAYKSEKGLPVYDPVREKEKLLRISKELPEELRDSGVALFRMLFELSKSRQAELLGESGAPAACRGAKGDRYGLLGEHLGHSYSPRIHSMLASYGYELFEKAPEEVEDFVRNGDWKGLNVTIPYKKTVIPYCTELSEKAARIGAVNTLVRREDGGIFGDNTDAYGFGKLIGANGIEIKDKKCLVFGSGGASAMAVEVLKSLGAQDVTVISRRGENNYDNLYLHSDAELIVNTTPVGMFPKNGEQAADLRLFPKLKAVLDVVYNPDRTALLLQAEALGIKHCNGLYMLVAQAKRSSELFTGEEIPDEKIGEITDALRKEALNTVLIGMPGCGKSSIAKLLSKKLSRSVIEADALIEEKAGMSIPEIFADRGEEGFRKLETEVLAEQGKLSGKIISTGGGCVTRQENYPLLHQNGTIVWIKRDLSLLPKDGRPLSLKNDLGEMYEKRKPCYERFADIEINNDGESEAAVQGILEALK